MSASFDHLRKTWEALGEEDPFWAIASEPSKKGGRWELADFLKSGEELVEQYWKILRREGAPETFDQVLDFGCGVGRLTLAWTRHASQVTGVDISRPMVEKGRQIMAGQEAIHFELNQRDDLSLFPDNHFDLVFSHVVLQHMPWSLAQVYLSEFARICKPGGWVAFQLPFDPGQSQTMSWLRRRIVDALPFGLGGAYRRWRRGTSRLFEMHFTPPEKVETILTRGGMEVRHREPDEPGGGPGTRGFLYFARKTG